MIAHSQTVPDAGTLLRDLVGRELTVGQLQNAALVLIGYYAQKGYLARVFLPPQDIKDGVVEYQVIEAVRGILKRRRTMPWQRRPMRTRRRPTLQGTSHENFFGPSTRFCHKESRRRIL